MIKTLEVDGIVSQINMATSYDRELFEIIDDDNIDHYYNEFGGTPTPEELHEAYCCLCYDNDALVNTQYWSTAPKEDLEFWRVK